MFKSIQALILLALCLISTALMGQSSTTQWKPFKSTTGHFSVNFPGAAKETTQRSDDATTYSATLDAGDTSYIAAYSVFTKPNSDRVQAEAILDGAEGGMVKNMKAKIATKQSLSIQGMPARHIRYVFEEGGTDYAGESMLVFTGDKLYHMMVLSPVPGPDQEDAAKFITSFSIDSPQYFTESKQVSRNTSAK